MAKPTVRLELASNPSRVEAAGRREQVKEGSFIHTAPTELADINSADVVFLICWKAFGKDIRRGEGISPYVPSCFSFLEQFHLYPICTVGFSQVMNLL